MNSRIVIKHGDNENKCNHNFKTISENNHYLIKIIKHKCENCSRIEEYSILKTE